ncbi:hypothetical protein GF312_13370 [Candidatus Poribacteria bacterium]|nr:hypothetical protein [Candidatus Poribacteria bacterium]
MKATNTKLFTIILIVVFSLFFTKYNYAIIDTESLVGMWLFDQDDDIVEDMSGNGNDGTLMDKPEWVEGKFGEWYHLAWTLDGTQETVYVNGVLIGQFNKPHEGTLEGTHKLEIG